MRPAAVLTRQHYRRTSQASGQGQHLHDSQIGAYINAKNGVVGEESALQLGYGLAFVASRLKTWFYAQRPFSGHTGPALHSRGDHHSCYLTLLQVAGEILSTSSRVFRTATQEDIRIAAML